MLEGKVVLVTGAGNGIGAEIAKLAARKGAKVVVNDLGSSQSGVGADSSPAQKVADEIRAAGGQAVPSFHSIAAWDSAHAIVDDAVKAYGRLDVVVNNAGILRDVIFHKMTQNDWQSVIDVTLSGYFYVSRAAANLFRDQESGCFIHMTSTSGLIGNRAQVNYGAAKMGIAGLSRNIAMDMQRYNVRSNCIGPHAFSRMIETVPGQTEEQLQARAAKTRPDHIAQLIAFLSTDAASGVSGQIFGVRGNEIYLYNQPRPIRIMARPDGWTPEKLAEHWLPAVKNSFTPLERTRDVFGWDPI